MNSVKKYSIDKAKHKSKEYLELQNELDSLKSRIQRADSSTESDLHRYNQIQQQLNKHMHDKAQGAFMRSKTKYYELGERSSKYFFSLEKCNSKKKTMVKVRSPNGIITTGVQEISQQLVQHYSRLYTSNPEIKFNLINNTDNKISNTDKIKLEEDITLLELTNAVKQMPNNKTPGLDGLPIEIYKQFWEQLGHVYYESIIHAKQNGLLSLSARRGVISQIPKKDKDPLIIPNWRPLTMLNCDYKILAKTLALRLQPTLPNLIAEEQTGFMKNRNIVTNIRKTIEVIKSTHSRNMPAIVMVLDYHKCFDSIEHTAIWGCLRYFNFGEKFISWIKLLFTDLELCVQNKGNLSGFFQSSRSIQQGSPISSFLFLLCSQVLNELIKQNTKIKGIHLDDLNFLLSQFADDTTLFLSYDKETLEQVINTLDIMHYNTGLTVNYDKTNIYRVGSLAGTSAKIYTTKVFNWTNEPIKMLGIVIPIDPTIDITSLNYNNLPDKIRNICEQWSLRKTTLMGKVLIVNTLIASLLVYKMQVLPNMPVHIYNEISEIVQKFLWSGGSTKISNKILTKDKKYGGLRLVNILARQQALKIQWIVFITTNATWMSIFQHQLTFPITEIIWKCNFAYKHVKYLVKKSSDVFWREMLESWAHLNFVNDVQPEDIPSQILWINSHICIENRPIIFNNAYSRGLQTISQLFDNEGNFREIPQLINNYNLTQYQCIQLWHAIPRSWKQMIKTVNGVSDGYFYDKIQNESKLASIAYSKLIMGQFVLASRKTRWERKLRISLSENEFLKHLKRYT